MFDNIFISYAKEDANIAKQVYDFFDANGYKPWMDKDKLLPGQNWELEIHKALRNANFIILILSPISVQKRGYVQREFKMALGFSQDKLEDDIYIIPIKLGNCQVPDSLLKYQWTEYDDEYSMDSVLKSINHQIEKNIDFERKKLGLISRFEYEEIEHKEKITNGKADVEIYSSVINFKDSTNNSLSELNKLINGSMTEYIVNSRKSFYESDEKEQSWTFDFTQQVNYLGKNIVSIVENLYQYTGGAHGNYGIMGLNFTLNPTTKIDLYSIVDYVEFDDFLKFISNFCFENLKEQYKNDLGDNFASGEQVFFDGSLDPKIENFENFLLSATSIDFNFNPYQILPYSFGMSTVSIPYTLIIDNLKNKQKFQALLDMRS